MKSAFSICILAWLFAASASAQVNDSSLPVERLPKVPTRNLKRIEPLSKIHAPQPPGDDQPVEPKTMLRGIVIVKSRADIKSTGVEAMGGLDVQGIPLLDRHELSRAIGPFLGQPLSFNLVRRVETAIILYCRERNRPLVDVVLPEQDYRNGVLQLIFIEGHVGNVTVENPGKRWSSDQLVRQQVRLQHGDVVDTGKLNSDLDWLNQNPFRQVNVVFKQGTKEGESDILLRVDDRLPVRPYVGYEDSGTTSTGEDRVYAGFNWGNVFGLDHQLNYQYTTDTEFDLVKAHAMSYLAPLPWRHRLTLLGSYVDARADFGGGLLSSAGVNYQTSLRYAVPLPGTQRFQHEVLGGFDFKSEDNDFEFGGVSQSSERTHILQFLLAYSGLFYDPWGQTTFSAEGYYSPGDLTDRNDDESFTAFRLGTSAEYVYGRLTLERLTRLPFDCSLVLRGSAQISSERLLPSEQLGVGGYRTVRGYDERTANGDQGWLAGVELRSPPIKFGNLFRDPGGGTNLFQFKVGTPQGDSGGDFLQLLGFFDYGRAHVIDADPSNGEVSNIELYSAGVGFRLTMSKHVSVRFDYGWQLGDEFADQDRSRAHLGALLSY